MDVASLFKKGIEKQLLDVDDYIFKPERIDMVIDKGLVSEYDAETLAQEYFRDLDAGKEIEMPKNYFPNDDIKKSPRVSWRSHANLLYTNWLNYFVYQTTPYDIEKIKK